MLKIDTHAHYLPRDWPNLARKYGDDRFPVIHHTEDGRHRIYKDGKFFREIWSKTWDPQERIDDYARFGVQVQVISTVPVMFSYWAKPHHALELHQALNEHMAEACREYPRHYAGIGTVPMQSPRLAIQELERCMDQLGLQGVQIGSHINDWNLDAPELFDFFQAAGELGAAIRSLDTALRPQVEEIKVLEAQLERIEQRQREALQSEEGIDLAALQADAQRITEELEGKRNQLKLDYAAQREALVGPVQTRVSERARAFATENGCDEMKMARTGDLASLQAASARKSVGPAGNCAALDLNWQSNSQRMNALVVGADRLSGLGEIA